MLLAAFLLSCVHVPVIVRPVQVHEKMAPGWVELHFQQRSAVDNQYSRAMHRCPGAENLLSAIQLQDRYDALYCKLGRECDQLLGMWMVDLKMPRPRALCLASGIGGEAYGVMAAGFDVDAVDIDLGGVCEKQFPTVHPRTGAVATFTRRCMWMHLKGLGSRVSLYALMTAGVPCNKYSSVPMLTESVRDEREEQLDDMEAGACVHVSLPGCVGRGSPWPPEGPRLAQSPSQPPTARCPQHGILDGPPSPFHVHLQLGVAR